MSDSSSNRAAVPERRIYPRHRVRVSVLWRNRFQETMAGEICDISARGLFVVSPTALPDSVGVGDATTITVKTPSGEGVLTGMVRWRGYHPLHHAIGCGVQLDEESTEVVLKLFPVLRQSVETRRASDPQA